MLFLKAFIALLFFLLNFTFNTEALEYLFHICSNTTTFAVNSTYQSNLNLLLSSLSSNATQSNVNGFYRTSVGRDPNDIYGYFLCRGDVSTKVCQDCVFNASKTIVQRCPIEKEAVIWYDMCLLRYSNRSIFSTSDQTVAVYMWNAQNITDPTRFNRLVGTTMNNITTTAANAPSGAKKFAVKQIDFDGFQDLYSLVQCTPDLSSFDCRQCLQAAIGNLPQCCSGRKGGRVLFPSCNIRYETYEFYNATAATPPPPPVAFSPPQAPPSLATSKGKNGISTVAIVAIVTSIAIAVALFCLGFYFLSRRRRNKYHPAQETDDVNEITTLESLQFDFETIEKATEGFSEGKKLGEGGFGEVYQGTLPNGNEVAVKRLSRGSGQGVGEFKNEVILLAKLQHRNLVRLLGFCLEREEKILVYEFVPNKSLDYFLFDPEKGRLLHWSRRYKIVGGIARGILYLHEDSRLRIIHRDLKASNILLDADMNAKISDFGMARIFQVDQTQASTNRIVGTYGYMSPEYAMHGQFSVKSDVYSFGVLILEIITGQKNSSFYQRDGCADLLSYVWRHWRDGTPLVVIDPTLADTYSRNEVIRCIHIGLLCVQEVPTQRPTMATIVLMLDSFSVTLPLPQEPAFYYPSRTEGSLPMKELVGDESSSKSVPVSVDEDSITQVYPR